jgi:multidrug resistance efflux pump
VEVILLGIYCFVVWLVFIKFKLLPWTTPWKVGVFMFPVIALATMLLLLNIGAPTTSDVRVVKYVVPVVPGVRGRVLEVPVENNRPVKKGDVLFKVDPTQYEADLNSLEADLQSDLARIASEQAKLNEMNARLADAQSQEPQLTEKLRNATEQIGALQASLELAQKRVAQYTELTSTGAGARFDLEQAQTNVKELTAQIAAAQANEANVRQQLSGRVRGELATVAETRAQIATAQAQVKVAEAQADTTRAKIAHAKYDLTQTTVLAPGNGTMVNVMLRPGYFVGALAFSEVMTFVDSEYQIFALFNQNELHQVEPGNEAEITLDTYPGHVIKAHVDSIIWAQSQGQMDASGNLPQFTFNPPPGQFPVKLVVGKEDNELFLAAGARGSAAIYTNSFSMIHIIRKVLLRTASYLDYIIIKHSISLH